MIVRKIREEEFPRTQELFHIAFEMPRREETPAQERLQQMKTDPQDHNDTYFRERWAAFEDDNQTMMAFIAGMPYRIAFDGHNCEMRGIGAVSSLAPYRRQGAIRGCFQKALEEMYEGGTEFSALYPFSTSYYRQFGYEIGAAFHRYTISMRAIPKFEVGGYVRLNEQGSCLADIRAVYDVFRAGYNQMVFCEEIDYAWARENRPAEDGRYTYVYYSAQGTPKGVMSFTKERIGDPPVLSDGRFKMSVSRLWFADREGLKGLLNHCRAFETYYERVELDLPEGMDLTPLIPEWARYFWECRRYFKGMVRVVNVKKVLGLAAYRGSGRLLLGVHDSLLPQNDHTFLVEFCDGRAVSVEEADGRQPDMECGIGDFSRLILGTQESAALPWLEGVRLNAPMELAEKVFYKKPVYLTEYF